MAHGRSMVALTIIVVVFAVSASVRALAGGDHRCEGIVGDPHPGYGPDQLICGTGGVNLIYAGWGDDLVYGRGGDDRIVGGRGRDVIHAGRGFDVCFVQPVDVVTDCERLPDHRPRHSAP